VDYSVDVTFGETIDSHEGFGNIAIVVFSTKMATLSVREDLFIRNPSVDATNQKMCHSHSGTGRVRGGYTQQFAKDVSRRLEYPYESIVALSITTLEHIICSSASWYYYGTNGSNADRKVQYLRCEKVLLEERRFEQSSK
jgi:hypothetical protein